ncbi:hypothetical protein XENOCAPTIV_009068 [Xenoophorus captivus]|uniref:Uncharacterized protein n=1 Tax=Xenoophorus captivus TaxID=1517983 RepID=A0ABV0QIE3_9TELE
MQTHQNNECPFAFRYKNKVLSLYPFILAVSQEGWCLSPLGYTLDRSPVHSLQGNTETNNYAHTHPPKGNLERTIDNFWTVGGNQSNWREPIYARGEQANSMQKDLRPDLNPRPSCYQLCHRAARN